MTELFEDLRLALAQKADPQKLCKIGVALHQMGQREAALAAFEAAVKEEPQVAIWHIISALRLELGLTHGAVAACDQALQLDPANPDSLLNAGIALAAAGDFVGALNCYETAIQMNPLHLGALCNRPMMYAKLERYNDAVSSVRAALIHYPGEALLHFNHGELLLGMRQARKAIEAYRQALTQKPDFSAARYGLALALAAEGELSAAIEEQRSALAQTPELATNYRSPLAQDVGSKSIDLNPARVAVLARMDEIQSGDWSRYTESVALFAEAIKGGNGLAPLTQVEMPHFAMLLPINESLQQILAQQVASKLAHVDANKKLIRLSRPKRDVLRIGYVSADFRPHPMASTMGDIYKRHDRSRFHITAYSVGETSESPERKRVIEGVDVFRDVHTIPDLALAQWIVNDSIDILIDLSGYTLHGRPAIFSLRPAPIQIGYLGFMGTMGAPWMDYLLFERSILPPLNRPFYDEKIAYLPDCVYHCELPESPVATSRAEFGLPEQALVLGALHMPRKLEPESLSVWLKLLLELPNTVLWLIHETADQVSNLRQFANCNGVAGERLIFSNPVGQREHLARLRQVDIFLDNFIYNGHKTTIDALSMGAPVVTLCGSRVVSRIAASMLRAHGASELVAESVDEYKAIVRRLATDHEWRKEVRARVSNYENSNLFCPERRVREIETAYEMMWARHVAGLPPEDFDVPPVSLNSGA